MNNKKIQTRVIVAAYTLALIATSRTGLSLVLSNISQQFPNVSAASIQFIFTLANGAGLFGSLFAGMLANKLTKKSLLMLFMAVTIAGGLLGYFFWSKIAMLYIVSLLLGIGLGGSNPIGTSLFAEYFDSEHRTKLIGFQSVLISVGGIATTLLAGILVATRWQNIYLLYLLAVPVLAVILIILPKGAIETAPTENKIAVSGKVLNPAIVKIYIQTLVISITWVVYNSNVSFLLEGDTSKSSYATAIFMIGMTIAGFLVAPFRKWFKKYGMAVSMLLCALSLWIFTFSVGHIVILCIGAALLGIGYCAYTALAYSAIPEISTAGKVTKTMSYFAVISTLGSLLHPYLITAPAALINTSIMTRFYICAVLLSLGTVFAFYAQIGKHS